MSIAAERLRQARADAGFETASSAAERFSWSKPTYLAHENGSRGITAEAAARYAKAYGVKPEWLLYGSVASGVSTAAFSSSVSDHKESVAGNDVLVPIFNIHASAGPGALVDYHEEVVDRLVFSKSHLRRITSANPADLAIIGVKGDSMAPTLADNDIVMVDTGRRDLSFDGLFVLRDGGESLLVKRIGRGSRRGMVVLISDNRTYPPIEREAEDIDVVGKVVWMGVKV